MRGAFSFPWIMNIEPPTREVFGRFGPLRRRPHSVGGFRITDSLRGLAPEEQERYWETGQASGKERHPFQSGMLLRHQ